jgi:RNA 2',3'-cyclic 3'-phosphodiesterase
MRLFVAVELDEQVRQNAGRLARDLGREIDRAGGGGRISWVAPANLHLTLRFLGEVAPALAAQLAGRLAAPFDQPAFDVHVSGVGVFPPVGAPRVIWLGIVDGASALVALHREVEARLDGLGFERADRPFRAHLTVGRVKSPPGPRLAGALARAAGAEAGRSAVDRVTLFESVLSPRGPAYSVLAAGPLAPRRVP